MSIPTSYTSAAAYLGKKTDRPAANNTRVQTRDGGKIAVRLHSTDIVTWSPDGSAVLNSGGWRTPTTKSRINDATPARLYQKGGVWYHGDGHPFADGDTINADGSRRVSLASPDTAKETRDLSRRIAKFARDLAAALPLPAPSGGDCFYCAMFPDEPGECNGSHLESHMEESYFVPSLALRALREAKAGDLIVSATFSESGHWTELARTYTGRAVRNYLKRRLAIAR